MSNQVRDNIIAWLVQEKNTKASFERIISQVPGADNYSQLAEIVRGNPDKFRTARFKGGLEGLAFVDGYSPKGEPETELTNDEIRVAPLETAAPGNVIVATDPTPAPPVVSVPTVGDLATIEGVEHVLAFVPVKTVDPTDYVVQLLSKAAKDTVSGASKNYAEAAFAAAQSLATLKHISNMPTRNNSVEA